MTSSLLDREDSTKTFSQSQLRQVSRKQQEQDRKSNNVPTKKVELICKDNTGEKFNKNLGYRHQ